MAIAQVYPLALTSLGNGWHVRGGVLGVVCDGWRVTGGM